MKVPCSHSLSILLVTCAGFVSGPETAQAADQRNGAPVAIGYSYSRPNEVALRHLNLTLTVDFKKRQLSGRAEYEIENTKRVTRLLLDTRDLSIQEVTTGRGSAPAEFELGPSDSLLGRPLVITITPETRFVAITYTTSPGAEALQWLKPAQTMGKKKPFLYSQSEPILARTWLPCQDVPSVRLTYRATVKTPPGMMAVMSAISPRKQNSRGVYEFDMPQPIAPYLIALAVGDIEFTATGKRTGVYAEPPVLSKAAWELADSERMVAVAESLYGPYRWGRYDVLILPPVYPIGGMENARLTFATPTILTGDRSQMGLIAHELGHSWSGNLVTCASWDDLWLNESFTTYLERRIDEAVWGKDFADMESVNGKHDLDEEVKRLGPASPETQLYLDLGSRDPVLADREVVYEKGYLFLRAIEEAAGRRRWDAFLRTYFDRFAYQCLTTARFVAYYKETFAKKDSVLNARVNLDTWLNAPGIPDSAPVLRSRRFESVEAEVRQWQTGAAARPLKTASWSTQEWVYFLHLLPDTLSAERLSRLDLAFRFSASKNSEILSTWLLLAVRHDYQGANAALEAFLTTTGRMKYLLPLYRALIVSPEGAELAKSIFTKAKPAYHPIAVAAVEEILGNR